MIPTDPQERETAVTAGIRKEVIRRLDAVEREEDVRVLYACESGSRAWGFASPATNPPSPWEVEAPPALEALDLLFRTMLEEAWMDRHSGGRAGSG